LVVDDERGIRTLLRMILEGAWYRVSEAGSGKEALRAIRKAAPDVMLVDLSMPDMDGLGLIREIRTSRHKPKVILALTGSLGGTTLRAAEDLGADGILAKPFRPVQVLSEIRRVLQES
jgi:CheY-like chemotaxis protein